MGNTLVTSGSNRNINDSILGKRIKEILKSQKIPHDDYKDGLPINKMVACCTGNAVEGASVNKNQFITINLPTALDETHIDCKDKGYCIESSKLGLQFPNTKCDVNWVKGNKGTCDRLIVNKCAKELYDSGCLKIKTNSKGKKVRVWDSKNKNCFDKRGNLIYGSEECVCLNSATGYNLNMDPSTKIKGGVAFRNKDENPYGLEGPASGKYSGDNNNYTKYSLDIFGYEPQYQYPNVFDGRCAGRQASVEAGESKPYKLSSYEKTPNICLNQINIKDSDIGQANMSNIKQNNNCGGPTKGKPLKVEENPVERETRINKEKEIKKREADRIEKEKQDRLDKEEELKKEQIIQEEEQQEKTRQDMIEKIRLKSESKKKVNDLSKTKILLEQENEEYEMNSKLIDEENDLIKQKLKDKELKLKQKEQDLIDASIIAEEKLEATVLKNNNFNRNLLIGGSVLFFILILVLIIFMINGNSEQKK